MTDNTISLAIPTQQQQQQQPQQATSPQKPRPLGRVRVQGQRAGPAGSRNSSVDFSVHGEAFSTVEKQVAISSSTSSLPPIGGQQTPHPQLQQRQPSVQSLSSSPPPPSDSGRLVRLQQREQELMKKLQDAAAREKLLREQLERLEKMLAMVQQLLEDEKLSKQSKETDLAQVSDKYHRLYEEECRAHEATRERLDQLQAQHELESARMQAQIGELKARLGQLAEQHEAQLAQLLREHQDALSDRDRRIDNLKRQVAGALGTNSHERQSQIDQLNRELQKVTDEMEAMRKRTPGGGGGACLQCPKKDTALREQGEHIRQLRAICQRFRGQLGEQDQALIALLDRSPAPGSGGAPKAKR